MREKVNAWFTKSILIGLGLFLLVLPFQLVVKRLVADPLGTYWKEILLGGLVVLWGISCLVQRKWPFAGTRLDWAILIFAGLIVLRFLLDGLTTNAAWGMYFSLMYLPVAWLVFFVFRRHPQRLTRLFSLVVGVGALISIGGLAEFFLNRTLWPSPDAIQRQGFPDVYVYSTHLRRVYFVFDSPTTLANTLALLLPLALVLIFVSRSWWSRIFHAASALLMLACILVTFSRGIWVAVGISLLAVLVIKGLEFRDPSKAIKGSFRKAVFFLIPGVLLLGGLGAVLFLVGRTEQTNPVTKGVVELPPDAFASVSVVSSQPQPLSAKPLFGEAEYQTWRIADPITQVNDSRQVLYEHPPQSGKIEIIYRMSIPEQGALKFGIALSPQVWTPEKGDGADFQIYIADPASPTSGQLIFDRYINPKLSASDRRWRNFFVDLSPWAGRKVNISLITNSGPAGDWGFDWAGWSNLEVVSTNPVLFQQNQQQAENALVSHLRSIGNWTQDETNRDRLAAWSTGLDSWRRAPIFGTGLGTTGEAALRTMPDQAYATESQMLKALTELGIPGLLTLLYLWFAIGKLGIQAYRKTSSSNDRLLLLGVLMGLMVIFIEGWVYQNLEVKQVNAYFWMLVGALGVLASGSDATHA